MAFNKKQIFHWYLKNAKDEVQKETGYFVVSVGEDTRNLVNF